MMFYLLLGIAGLVLAVRHLLLRWRSVQNLRSVHIANETDEDLAEVEGSIWPQLSVFQHVERGLKRNSDKAAVICLMEQSVNIQKLVATCSKESELQRQEPNSFTLTYAQLHCTALKLAIGLLDIGVQPNTRMMMLIPNGAEYTILLWACLILRITYVSIDPVLLNNPDFNALKQRLHTIKPQLVVIPDARNGKAVDTAISELGLPQPVKICLSSTVSIPTVWRTLVDVATRANSQDMMDEVSLLSAARCDDSTRINSIMFTSGTSGIPKACPQTVGAISHALHSQEWLIDPDSGVAEYALMQPHNSRGIAPAQTLQTWRAGGTVVLTGQTFSVHDAIKAIEQLGASFLVLTPPMVHEFAVKLAAKPVDLSCVKRVQVGGDAVTKEVLVKCVALFPWAQVCVNQGMTEGPGVFTWPFLETPIQDIPFFGDQICPVGVVAPGAKIRLCSTSRQGTIVKRGELGELHISCPSIIKHYLGGDSEHSFYNDKNTRWFNTGDMAMIDSNGVVFILGRRKDMIQRAGVTIAPAAIESCVAAFIQCQTVVVTVPHPTSGTEPIAVIDSFANANVEQVKQHIRVTLGEYYAVREVICLKQLGLVHFPVNATHKIVKSEVQDAVLEYLKHTPIRELSED